MYIVIMAEAEIEKKLEQRHGQTAELVAYTKELVEMLESGDPAIRDVGKLRDKCSTVTDKIDKAQRTTTSTKEALADCISQNISKKLTIIEELQKLLSVNGADEATLRLKIADLKQEALQKERECKQLMREHKRVQNSKVRRRLQRAIVNVNFDLLSTEQNVRGYIKSSSSSNDLQTFEIDYSKEDPCDVADRLWNLAC